MKRTKEEILNELASILSQLSSYRKDEIIDLVKFSEDTNLQLAALVPSAHKDVLADEIVKKFNFLNQVALEDALFTDLKTVEAIINYIYEKQP